MIKLELVLSPDEADLVMRAIDCGRAMDAEKQKAKHGKGSAETPPEQSWPSHADGLVTVAAGYLAGNAGTDSGGDRYQVMVHVDQDPLGPDGSQAVTLDDGSRISAETLRRVACDCGLVAVAGDSPLNVGRRTRSIPPAIRRALHLRDHGCRFPGCRNQRFLHGHHVVHWLHGGETSIDNLIQLCSHHHRLVHEGGWSIVRAEDGTWTFVAPSGQGLVNEAREAWHGRIVGWLQEWSDKHQLALGPDTNEPLWDGEPPNYDEAVGGLLRLG